jgi:hypothetical protein
MTTTHREFFRLLPVTLEPYEWSRNGLVITIKVGGGVVTITLSEEGVRKIALLQLAVVTVVFEYENVPAAALEKFMHRFDNYYRRGGG